MKSCKMGGQAVIEGVMMRYKNNVAVAVRKADGSIKVGRTKYAAATSKHPFLKWPLVRGVVSFVDSLVLGIKTLMYSASIFEDDIDEEIEKEKKAKEAAADDRSEPERAEKSSAKENKVIKEHMNAKKQSGGETAVMVGTVLFSLIIALLLFVALPYYVSSLITKVIDSSILLAVVEGILKVAIFIGYIAVIGQMKDIKRTFMYHGAEHKCINCIESGKDLTVDNVMESSKEHRRCGTSFIFLVLIISIIFHIFILVDARWLRFVIRILIIPVIAAVSYELIQWAGNSDSKIAYYVSRPGLWMQALTTKEPTRDMVEVAIESVNGVFNWKKYVEDLRIEMAREERKAIRKERHDRKKGLADAGICVADPYEDIQDIEEPEIAEVIEAESKK